MLTVGSKEFVATAAFFLRLGVGDTVVYPSRAYPTYEIGAVFAGATGFASDDPAAWPDPAAMVRELDAMGVRVMVSVWPTVNPHSVNLDALRQGGWLLRDRAGQPARSRFIDRQPEGPLDLYLLDATHPDARAFFWQRLHEGYYRHGIKLFWLDADEPEMDPLRPEHLRYAAGEGAAVANLYPERHARAVYEGAVSYTHLTLPKLYSV